MNEVHGDRADPSLTFCRFVSVYRIDATKVRGPWRVGMSQIQLRRVTSAAELRRAFEVIASRATGCPA